MTPFGPLPLSQFPIDWLMCAAATLAGASRVIHPGRVPFWRLTRRPVSFRGYVCKG